METKIFISVIAYIAIINFLNNNFEQGFRLFWPLCFGITVANYLTFPWQLIFLVISLLVVLCLRYSPYYKYQFIVVVTGLVITDILIKFQKIDFQLLAIKFAPFAQSIIR